MPIKEKDLILPALYVIKRDGKVTMSNLIKELTAVFNPTGDDAVILDNRKDTKFSQKVRNLRSHRDTNGMEEYTTLTGSGYRLTPEGEKLLESRLEELDYLFSQKFDYDDVKAFASHISDKRRKVTVINEDETVNEGRLKDSNSKTRERSRKLRDAAIKHYSAAGKIKCEVCGFCFEDKYGEQGKDFIEIYHEKPVCDYGSQGQEKTIADALANVKPLCSNCHRMIHRNPKKILSIGELKAMTK